MQRSDHLKVSVVMATYNGIPYIEEQLRSIDFQSSSPDEVVVVDDCSNDGTWEFLQLYAANRKNFRLFRNESNGGVNSTFMKAISLVKGDVIFISDQDDVWHEDKIKIMLSAWEGESLVYSNALVVNQDGMVKCSDELSFFGVPVVSGNNPWFFLGCNCVSGHNAMITRDLAQFSRFQVPQGVVYDQWVALLASARGGIKFVPELLCHHRIHSRNANNNPALRVGQEKKKGMGEKRRRFYEKRGHLKSLVVALASYEHEVADFSRTINLFNKHFDGFDGRYFGWGLFFHLWGRRHCLFPGVEFRRVVRKLRNLSLGGRAYWLP